MLVALLAVALVVALVYAIRNPREVRNNDIVTTTFHIQPPQRRAGFGQIAISPLNLPE